MTIKPEIIIQTGKQAKKGIFFYKPLDDTQDLIALSVYLEKVLSWMQNGEEEFPTPPQDEDFIVPDLPSDELLNKTYPLITDQIKYYIRGDNGWISKSISDQERIDDIIGEISFSSLRALAPAKQSICEPDIYIDFNNGTVLACSESPTYIWFGHQIDTAQDENESISFYGEYIGPYSVRDPDLSNFLLRWMYGDIAANDPEIQYPWEVEKEDELSFDLSGKVVFTVEEDTLSSTGATFVISNLGTEKAMYGRKYEVQIMIDNEWYSICEGSDWTMEGYFLMPGESDSLDINWTRIYGELPASKYRLIKSYRLRIESPYSERSYSDEAYIYCEFDIP